MEELNMIHLEDITEEVEIPKPGEIDLFGKFLGDLIPLSRVEAIEENHD